MVRHGKARAYVLINHQPYLIRKLRRDHYHLEAQGGERDGAQYQVGRTATGHYCTCPDHLYRNVRCKHVGALTALRMLSWPRRRKGAGHA
jgi:uncharacterized Zn finger protein